jgi:hypothetical protein
VRINDSASCGICSPRSGDRLDRDLVFRAGVQVLLIVLKATDRAIKRHHAQPICGVPAIQNLKVTIDDIDEDAAEHRDAVASIERAERAGKRAVADVRHLAPRKVSSTSAAWWRLAPAQVRHRHGAAGIARSR